MQNTSDLSPIIFPWKGDLPADEIIILRDIDVVGVGAIRRKQIEEIQKQRQIILHTYEAEIPKSVLSIYNEEMLRTLHWLRPLRTEIGPSLRIHDEQVQLFHRLFPQTEKKLGLAAGKVRDEYLAEMEWSSWLLQDHWRYFSGYVRQKFPMNRDLQETVQMEWVQAWLEVQPFVVPSMEDPGVVVLNPSMQVVHRASGLFVFVYDNAKGLIVGRSLDPFEACLLDILSEDRKYTLDQLLKMAGLNDEIKPVLTESQWLQKFEVLKDAAIIIQM